MTALLLIFGLVVPSVVPPPRVVPWLEYAATPGAYESAVRGLREWRTVTDRAIVSINYAADYPALARLRADVPGLRIIPGVKTWPFVGDDFTGEAAWDRIGAAVRQVLALSGENTCLLENETAIMPYVSGRADIDLERLRRCLSRLPAGVRYVWYPCTSASPERLERYQRINRVVQDVLASGGVELVDTVALWGPAEAGTTPYLRSATALRDLATLRPVPLLYCYGDSPGQYARVWWWPDADVRGAALSVRYVADTVIVYPGAKRWAESAPVLARSFQPPAGRSTCWVAAPWMQGWGVPPQTPPNSALTLTVNPCFFGPGVAVDTPDACGGRGTCGAYDLDGDGDVDLADGAEGQRRGMP